MLSFRFSYFILIMAGLVIPSCKKEKPLIATDFCSLIHQVDTSSITSHLSASDMSLIGKSGAYVLEEGDGSMIARAWLSEHASKSIDIQYFIFSVDNVGLIACDYLVRAADRGVKVRVLVDDIMVEASPEDIMVMNAHPNIDIKIYNPGTNIGKNLFQKGKAILTDFKGINQRMHNKTFIVDGLAVITGGRNIADEYFDYDHEYNFRDRDIFLIGDVVNDVKNSFDKFWSNSLSEDVSNLIKAKKSIIADTNRYEKLHQYACDSSNYWPQVRQRVTHIPEAFDEIVHSGDLVIPDSIFFVSDRPGKNISPGLSSSGLTTEKLIKFVNEARFSIDIQSPYLITTDLSREIFRKAVNRGVKIRILTNSLASTDNLEAFSGYQRDRRKLLQTGVEIYEFKPDAICRYHVMTGALQQKINFKPVFGLHAKTMVIDGNISLVGTFNLDPRSANLNTECFTIVYSQRLTTGILNGINEEFLPENSWHTTKSWNPDHLVDNKKRLKTFMRKVVPKSIL